MGHRRAARFHRFAAGAGRWRAAGSVESRCENCHGAFGESNEVFTPIVGGTTAEDVKTGHVASLRSDTVPQRTTR